MSILKIAQIGHPVLRQISAPVSVEDISSDAIQNLIADMTDTMREYGGVGLAAPQVHNSVRMVLIEVQGNTRYTEAPDIPLVALINPVLTPMSEETEEDWESCLSVEGFRGRVPRYTGIHCDALDGNGKSITLDVEGFFARVLQHECDHLEGYLYVDRMRDMSSFTTMDNFMRHWYEPPTND